MMFSRDFDNIIGENGDLTKSNENLYTYYYITEYLTEIVFKYTNNGQINLHEYFREVFVKNIDVWGFIMIYAPIIEYFYDNYNKLNEYEIDVFEKLRNIFIHFLFETPTEVINVKDLTVELKDLGALFEKCEKHQSNRNKTPTTKISSSSIFSKTFDTFK